MDCGAAEVAGAMRAMAAAMTEHSAELVELDRAIGDGDHGENMKRGFDAVGSALDGAEAESPAAVLKLAATTLLSTVGGAAGPLYGTAFLRAANVLGDADVVTEGGFIEAIRAASEGVRERGKATDGDATMVDALSPAASAAESAAGSGIAAVLSAAADAADDGAASTVDRVARKGRASYLGERAVGHLDPGARSTALLLRAMATEAG